MALPIPTSRVEDLGYELLTTIETCLNENSAWKLVAEASGIFRPHDIAQIGKKPSPSSELLLELIIRRCIVCKLCDFLEKCKLYNLLVLLKECEPAVITTQPTGNCSESGDERKSDIPLGGELKLQCQARGLPPPTYTWYHENVEIPGQTTGQLCLQDFRVDNEGDYYCCVSQETNDGIKEVYSMRVNVHVCEEAPTCPEQPKKQLKCMEGDNVTITGTFGICGHPTSTFRWYHETQSITQWVATNELTLRNAKISDGGKYRCLARNKVGEAWSSIIEVVVEHNPFPRNFPTVKVALLIANDKYNKLKDLITPLNDVRTLANQLNVLGFKVITLQNLTLNEMRNAVDTFCRRLPAGAYALFYYAGHGFEMQDKYMLPVDSPGLEKYLRKDCLCEKEIIRNVLETSPKLAVILLDMCLLVPNKDVNPGIYQELPILIEYNPGRNLIQGYATTSNLAAYERRTDNNSIYMTHLNKLILENLPVIEMLKNVASLVSKDPSRDVVEKQMPSHTANIVGLFYLNDVPKGDIETDAAFERLNYLPPIYIFGDEPTPQFDFSPLCGFHNAMEIKISHLDQWHVLCVANNQDVKVELEKRTGNTLIAKVLHLQRLDKPLVLTISLCGVKNGPIVHQYTLSLGYPLIAQKKFWRNESVVTNK